VAKKTLRAGMVGTGFAAAFHYEALKRVTGVKVEVSGVFSIDKDQARAYATQRELKVFDSLDALLDASDVVHVVVPPSAHEEVTLAALAKDRNVIVEKPLTGYFGDGSESFRGDTCSKQVALDHALASIERILRAEERSKGRLFYAENWVYMPAVQKEREIIEKTGAQILWIHGEEAHSGSHAKTYAYWKFSGGGVMIGKGCHPLSAALYLKRVEGLARSGKAIRPVAVSARTHAITRLKNFRDEGHLRADYFDIDDFSLMHVVFEDGMIATLIASDLVMGGIHNQLEVIANNHRTVCNINPNNAMATYNPVGAQFKDIYVVEKIGTKEGWSNPAADEASTSGYPQELEDFYCAVANSTPAQSDSGLASDSMATIYSAYVSADKRGAEVDVKRLG
jgi:predicted dehydrogenase